MERVTRRGAPESETDQAGLATRAVAGAIDLGLLTAAYALLFNLRAALIAALFTRPLSLAAVIVIVAVLVLIAGGIFAAFWALVGHTPGMRFFAIRLTQADGSREITLGCAVRRLFAVILSLLPLGLGYLAILRDPNRRAWADRMTGTQVI